jgi:hypothetical protein
MEPINPKFAHTGESREDYLMFAEMSIPIDRV